MRAKTRWYEPECYDIATELRRVVDKIISQHADRRREDSDYLRIHNHKDPTGVGRQENPFGQDGRVRYNLFRAATTTCRATIGSTKPAIKFGTTNADWSAMRRAKKREQAVRSVFDDNKVYELFKEIFTDALVTPIGAMKVYSEDGRVKIERVGPGELLVDRDEGYYRNPPNLYQIKPLGRDILYRLYPDKEEIVDRAGIGNAKDALDWLPGWDMGDDQVLVTEAWHLPVWDAASDAWVDGKHCIATTSGLVLDLEDYDVSGYPFAVYRWEKRSFGWPGMSLCEELRGHYETVAYLDFRIQDLLRNLSRVKMFVQKGTILDNISDDPLDTVEFDGTPPFQIYSPNVVPEELFTTRRETIQDAFRQIGINEMTMVGTKPPGDWSGIALQELKDSASQRFKDKLEEIEQFYIDLSKCIVREIERLSDAGELKQFKVRVARGSRYQVNEIDWSKNKLSEDEYWTETNSSSSLPQSTAGKLATIQAWQQMGWIDAQQARELMNLPDLENASSTEMAPYYEALDKIEDIVEDGKYSMPEGTDDLASTIRLTLGAYNKFKRMDLEPAKLEMLLQLIDDCERLEAAAQPQPMPAALPAEQPVAQAMPLGMPRQPQQILQ